ncbi:MAG: class II fructose-1,6-bisphosphate aldolase [Clostridia bacterium]|nr:class II fructose-1,6-bisphosphate aldolase [Clostridia bacterium]
MSLVNTKKMLEKAYNEGYAVGAFNVNNMEIIQGITEAASEMRSPLILQASAGARKYAGSVYLRKLVEAATELHRDIPIALHLDHGESFEICKECIESGFTSVMIDGSALPYEKNIEVTAKVAEYAHKYGVTVEAELGSLSGVEDNISIEKEKSFYTNPDQVVDFAKKTGIDSLAIAIGTSHGAYKFKPGQKRELRFDILSEIEKKIPNFPIVLHGASSVIPEFVSEINEFGGDIKEALGIPEELLSKAAKMSVCKINVDSDLRLAMTAKIRRSLYENPSNFDPRKYLSPAREAIKSIVKHKIKNVMHSENKIY